MIKVPETSRRYKWLIQFKKIKDWFVDQFTDFAIEAAETWKTDKVDFFLGVIIGLLILLCVTMIVGFIVFILFAIIEVCIVEPLIPLFVILIGGFISFIIWLVIHIGNKLSN